MDLGSYYFIRFWKTFNCTKSAATYNQQRIVRLTFIDFNPDDLRYYLFAVSFDVCGGSFNNFDDLSDRLYVPGIPEDVNLNVHNTIIGIKESK